MNTMTYYKHYSNMLGVIVVCHRIDCKYCFYYNHDKDRCINAYIGLILDKAKINGWYLIWNIEPYLK
jgi:hypothetical protein